MAREPDVVLAIWLDAARANEGDYLSPASAEQLDPIEFRTLGWVVVDSDDKLVLAQSLTARGEFADVVVIPRGMVTEQIEIIL